MRIEPLAVPVGTAVLDVLPRPHRTVDGHLEPTQHVGHGGGDRAQVLFVERLTEARDRCEPSSKRTDRALVACERLLRLSVAP